jgi:hypothetical protein
MVSELFDPRESKIPRYVIAHRQGEKPWEVTQTHCAKLPGKLAAFCRMLSATKTKPLARPLLGSHVALNETTANAIRDFRVAEISRMSGCASGELPDFLIVEKNHGGRNHGRPVAKIAKDGKPIIYPAVRAAARAEQVAPVSIRRRASRGHRGPDGAVWFF